jgi:hypothetical protein
MSASQQQSSLNTTFGPNDTKPSSTATQWTSQGSATAAGHGDHPVDNADESNVTMPGTRIGPQNEDLEGDKTAPAGEGAVMDAQFEKKNAGWGEEGSLTSDLERQKAEQQAAREELQNARKSGVNVDGGAGNRFENEGMGAV